jgi:hypothetical protein
MSADNLKCTNIVKRMPKERFRLPEDGERKWKGVAARRKALLIELSTYANGDGTFIGVNGRDYSPSIETLLESASSERSLYRTLDALQTLKYLKWTREKHYQRRSYTILLPSIANHLSYQGTNLLPNQPESPAKSEAETADHLPNETKSPATACRDIRPGPSLEEPSPTAPEKKSRVAADKCFSKCYREKMGKKLPIPPSAEERQELQSLSDQVGSKHFGGYVREWMESRHLEGLHHVVGRFLEELGDLISDKESIAREVANQEAFQAQQLAARRAEIEKRLSAIRAEKALETAAPF